MQSPPGVERGRQPPLSISLTPEGEDAQQPWKFDLQPGVREVVKIGRSSKNDIMISHPGTSGLHAELRLLPHGPDSHFVVGVCDVSSNGTGIRTGGVESETLRLEKGSPAEIQEGAALSLPVKVGPSGKPSAVLVFKYVN